MDAQERLSMVAEPLQWSESRMRPGEELFAVRTGHAGPNRRHHARRHAEMGASGCGRRYRLDPWRLGDELVRDGLISSEDRDWAIERQKATVPHKFLGEILRDLDLVPPKMLGRYVEGHTLVPFVELSDVEIDVRLAARMTELVAVRLVAIPIMHHGCNVIVAMSDPLNPGALREISYLLRRRITPVLAFQHDILAAVSRVFVCTETRPAGATPFRPSVSNDHPLDGAKGPYAARLVNKIIDAAVKRGATDIYIEPLEDEGRFWFHVGDVFVEQSALRMTPSILLAVTARVRMMAGFSAPERARRQEGRIVYSKNGLEHDLRVAVVPDKYGEIVAIRIL
jgi:type IV pilus assembly protein PilB